MTGTTLAFMLAGLVGFFAGAYLAANGERPIGIAMMAMGLAFQVLTLRQLKLAKSKEHRDARG
jgi:hypothetical protein